MQSPQLLSCLQNCEMWLCVMQELTQGCTVDEDLWDELGEEVPAEWDDDKPTRKRTGKPVPPGEYFTIIRGAKHVHGVLLPAVYSV